MKISMHLIFFAYYYSFQNLILPVIQSAQPCEVSRTNIPVSIL